MKDTVLNSILIAAAFSAILVAAIDDRASATHVAAIRGVVLLAAGNTAPHLPGAATDVVLAASVAE